MSRLEDLLAHLVLFFRPIMDGLQDEESLRRFFSEFGYELDATDAADALQSFHDAFNPALGALATAFSGGAPDLSSAQELFSSLKSVTESPSLQSLVAGGTQFDEELFTYLFYRHVSTEVPIAAATLKALGVLTVTHVKTTDPGGRDVDYDRIGLRWDRLGAFMSENDKWALDVYGWGATPGIDGRIFDYQLALDNLAFVVEATGLGLSRRSQLPSAQANMFLANNAGAVIEEVQIPVFQFGFDGIDADGQPTFNNEIGMKFVPSGDLNQPAKLGLAVAPFAKGQVSNEISISDELTLTSVVSGAATGGVYIQVNPEGVAVIGGAAVEAAFEFALTYANPDSSPVVLFGETGGTMVDARSIAVSIGGNLTGDFFFAGGMKGLRAVVDVGDDAFLSVIAPEPITVDVGDVVMGWRTGRGVYFEGGDSGGSAGLTLRLSPRLSIGPVEIPTAEVGIAPHKGGLRLHSTFEISLKLGVVDAAVEGIGVSTALAPATNGNLGPLQVALGFKPPKGLGLGVSAGPVRGGGYLFFDPDAGEYAGVLELSLGFLTLKAVGLLSTKLPGGGYSLLVIITAEFPPIQLGFGFSLLGVGGLLGVNRTVVVEVLRDGVRTGALGAILFPKDPVANAPQLLATLRSVFPPSEGRYTLGPMVKLGWGPNQLLEIEVALILELPSPLRLVVLGRLTAALPDKAAPLVLLRLDVLGIIDVDRGEISVDATLYDSRIAAFTVSGDMALRAGWKGSKGFALAVGGFHPRFSPPPGFPSLRRLTLALATGDNPRARLEAYFALTSNTVQFGARLDLFVAAGPFQASGRGSLDALIKLDPFHLLVNVIVSIDVAFEGHVFLHAKLDANLEGPAPWHAWGFIEAEVFVFKARLAVDLTVGEPAPREPARVDLKPILAAALAAPDAWSAQLPPSSSAGASLRAFPATEGLVVHPFGRFTVRQRAVPLALQLTRYGAALVEPGLRFDITGVTVGGTWVNTPTVTFDDFAPAQFADLTDDEKISRPSFEAMPSGVVATTPRYRWPVDTGDAVISHSSAIEYDEAIVDTPDDGGPPKVRPNSAKRVTLEEVLVGPLTETGAAARSAARERDAISGPTVEVQVVGERYVPAALDTLRLSATAGANATSFAQAVSQRGTGQLVTVGEVVP